MLNLSIRSLAYVIPGGRLTNGEIVELFAEKYFSHLPKDDLEQLVYGSKRKLDFLEIRTRSCSLDYSEEGSVQMAVRVSREAIAKAGMTPDDIDLLLFVGVCNPFREPSYSIILAHELEMQRGNYYDINDTCNGFLKALELASLYINSGKYRSILVVTSENPLELLEASNFTGRVDTLAEADYKMNLFFAGAGAAAMLLTADSGDKSVICYGEERNHADWELSLYVSPKISMPGPRFDGMDFMSWADGRGIAAGVIRDMPAFVYRFLDEHKLVKDEISYIFSHQLGRNITNSLLNKLEVQTDKVFPVNTFPDYGNMGSANIPIGLCMAEEQGLLRKGDSILLLGSACGLTYGAAYIVW
ncbi:3-oxoacyl-[acyl-carrier-protein] synthase III C-terminal domain-containing protein [Paenibacillus sp. FSL R7-0273]|uniref:3-oxoacyl-ACP synthase III family protein n=1 Tax=Paenibacillus sp. FSL R7-0273 TaxID=1536772 RepID=UPI0009DF223D|nr:3-oxoacyl-[acyl-carrier-protein] synthase III C-terminal domain-containing protein [Paenibacillus sp. FSL R7-0273]